MRFLLLNQVFYPDVASSGQHLTDLAEALARRGHSVTVVASRHAYDDAMKSFPARENWRGVKIIRVGNTRFGKAAKWRRAADFSTFILSVCWRLCLLPRQDVVVALTTPPLISFVAALFSKIRNWELAYWIMDLNPDEAIAAGWLRADSLVGKVLDSMSRFSLRHASKVIVLDRFMEAQILAKRIDKEKIAVIPPWCHDSEVRFDSGGRDLFRKAHGMHDQLVIMYAGNHSPCHPLDTVLHAALRLAGNLEIRFCFLGGGSGFSRVKKFAAEHSLLNVSCIPYLPLSELAGALSAADLHLVVMGNPFLGLVHPCKIYNILRVGSPVLYVGPQPSHISELLDELGDEFVSATVGHGQIDSFVKAVLKIKESSERSPINRTARGVRFTREILIPRITALLEKRGKLPGFLN